MSKRKLKIQEKKKYLFALLLFLFATVFIIPNVFAADDMKTSKVGSISKTDDFQSLQGMTIMGNHIISVYLNQDKKVYFYVTNLQGKKEAIFPVNNVSGGTLGHTNSITYNEKTNKLYVTGGTTNQVQSRYQKFSVFDGAALEKAIQNKKSVNAESEVNTPNLLKLNGLAYNADKNQYVAVTQASDPTKGREFYILDSNFQILKSFHDSTKYVNQVPAYKGDYIYYVYYDSSTSPRSSVIKVFDESGKTIKTYRTGKDIQEIEAIAFKGNTAYVNVNGTGAGIHKITNMVTKKATVEQAPPKVDTTPVVVQPTTNTDFSIVTDPDAWKKEEIQDPSRAKYCKVSNDTLLKERFGDRDTLVKNITLNGNTMTATGLTQDVKVAVAVYYYEPNTTNAKGIAKTDYQYPDAAGTVSVYVPNTIAANGQVYTVDTESVQLRVYPKEDFEDDTHKCLAKNLLYFFEVQQSVQNVLNSSYNKDYCVSYRNKYSDIPEMRQAVAYCFQTVVDHDYDEAEVKEWIQNAEDTYAFKQQTLANNKPLTPDDEHTVRDPKNVGGLLCDAYTPDVLNKDGSVKQYANSKTFNYKKTTYEGTYCRTICKETVTINYQAPIATQAGLCFSYKVEVKSKVECTTESTGVYPKMKQVCVPRASCYGTYDYDHDQGGPTEDFDRCVTSCDGGKYSQKCINSCYSKVYSDGERVKNMSSNLISYASSPKVIKMADVTCPPNSDGKKPTYGNWSAQQVYEFRKKYPGGHYEYSGNDVWEWIPGKDAEGHKISCPSYVGYYYFSTPQLTASTISGFRSIYASWGNGFKMQDSASFHCDSKCSWIGACPADSFQTSAEATKDYKAQQAAEKADWKKCKEKASCSETTTEYTITVDKSDKDSPNYKVYKATQKPGNSPSGDTIIEDYSGNCYDKEDGWEYRNVLSFPKTYLSVKTGLTTSLKPSNLNHFVYVGNSFCTSTKTEPVNLSWYNWKVFKNGDISQLTATQKNKIESTRVNNINVHIGSSKNHLWGLMGWNFDIDCFYAVADPRECTDEYCGSECSNPPGDDCPSGNCSPDEPVVHDYLFRSIALDDMFPPSESSPNGRSPRYNWSCQASNTLNEDYPVQPSAAIANIESKGNSIYNSDAELDYEIDLTKSTISKVRAYNSTRKSYLDFDEAAISSKTDGVTVYTSSFLTKTLGDAVKKRGIAGCNNQTNGVCDNTIVQDACFNALK